MGLDLGLPFLKHLLLDQRFILFKEGLSIQSFFHFAVPACSLLLASLECPLTTLLHASGLALDDRLKLGDASLGRRLCGAVHQCDVLVPLGQALGQLALAGGPVV